jgi:hypothetical protein
MFERMLAVPVGQEEIPAMRKAEILAELPKLKTHPRSAQCEQGREKRFPTSISCEERPASPRSAVAKHWRDGAAGSGRANVRRGAYLVAGTWGAVPLPGVVPGFWAEASSIKVAAGNMKGP